MFDFLKKLFSNKVESVGIELSFHDVPIASYPAIPKEILNQIKNGEKIMNNSETIEINGGDLFQWSDNTKINPDYLTGNYVKLSNDKTIFTDLSIGRYWTNQTLRGDLVTHIKKWLSSGELRKVPEGNSIRITQKTIKNEDDDPMERIQTLIESLEELGHRITESYNDHSLAIKQCEADLQYIKDITDS